MGAALGAAALGCGEDAADELLLGEAEGALPGSARALLAKVKNIVVLCQENRSFDHYLGARKLVEMQQINGLTGNEWNPTQECTKVPIFNLQDYTPSDPPHEWSDCHLQLHWEGGQNCPEQWNGGLNNGFVVSHPGPDQAQVMGYYVRNQIPTHYALADAYATCDAYHASVLGPTWPNRFYLHGGTAHGVKDATPLLAPPLGPGFLSIFEVLNAAGISAVNYFCDVPWAAAAYGKLTGLAHISEFFAAAEAGKLPRFCIIDPLYLGPLGNDDHPEKDVRLGQAFIATIHAALAKSPQWDDTLFIVTYDEHGGFFDHVTPPTIADDHPEFQQLGFRVPTICAGGRVRRGQVVSTTFDHASVVKTALVRHGIAPWNARLAAAADLSSVLDPAYTHDPQPPATIPAVPLSMADLAARVAAWDPLTDTAHAELREAANLGIIPPHLDHRSNGLSGSIMDILDWGAELGAIDILP